jgi:hypothetical protein
VSSIGLSKEKVYIGTETGDVVKLAMETGTIERAKVHSDVVTGVVVGGEALLTGSFDRKIIVSPL